MNITEIYKIYKTCNSVSTDTRIIEKGSMFFALKGPNFNANKLAEEALNKGADYVVIDDENYAVNDKCILVKDVLETLQELAEFYRQQLKIPVIGITGSNGKTTNKELINAVLSTQYKTFATQGNYNNHIGVPLTLLSIKPEVEIAIIEMGANHIGEIAFLCNIANPNYGLITNIGKAHIEGFGSVEGIVKGKTELYNHLIKNNGTVFYNADDEILSQQEKGNKTCTYGIEKPSNINGKLLSTTPYLSFEWQKKGVAPQKNDTHLFGAYNINNALAAVCIGNYFNISIENINKAIADYSPNNNRSQIFKTKLNTIILDCYNANPSSMQSAIESFEKQEVKNKVLILGDMLELGKIEAEEHKNIIKLAEAENISTYFIGKRFFQHRNDFANNELQFFEDKELFIAYIKNNLLKNKYILLKASRGMQLEILKDYL